MRFAYVLIGETKNGDVVLGVFREGWYEGALKFKTKIESRRIELWDLDFPKNGGEINWIKKPGKKWRLVEE